LEVDAGAPEETDAGDAATTDAGTALNLPEAGVSAEDKACAGSCNGARGCNFPGQGKTCGSTFCNDLQNAGRVTCDGRGNCSSITLAGCPAYVCDQAD